MMKILLKCLVILSLTACVSAEFDYPEGVEGDAEPINMQCKINQVHTRRVEDSGFADGDAIGVYVVNHEGGQPGALAPDGNHVTNVKFTFDEDAYKWDPETPVYWKDKVTPVDAYGYYPYREDIPNVRSMPFAVCSNQSDEDEDYGLGGYEASDFLWAKASGVCPSSRMISLEHNHMMASVIVSLLPGEGFTAEEWAALDKTVMVENTHLASFVDLSTGDVIVDESSELQPIMAAKDGEDWRAIVVPQNVDKGTALIYITVNGFGFHLTRESMMTFHQGKMHKFTIQVENSIPTGDYKFTLIDESVVVWESELISHNGEIREYFTVNVPKFGGLKKAFQDLDLDPETIRCIKLVGCMDETDCAYIRESMPFVEAINAYDVSFKDNLELKDKAIPEEAFCNLEFLRKFVFPKELKEIGEGAFANTQLQGDLIIPEGVERIGNSAFSTSDAAQVENNLTGRLNLPASLRYIGSYAFSKCKFTCELLLPDQLEYIGNSAFRKCDRLFGSLVIPEGISKIEYECFAQTKGLNGRVIIPEGVVEIGEYAFEQSGITSVVIPQSVSLIGNRAFAGTSLQGPLSLPEQLSYLGSKAFASTRITHVNLPVTIERLYSGTFQDCKELRDTIIIPNGIISIGAENFFGCDKLESVILPSGLEEIGDNAFANCFSLGYLFSAACVPPQMSNDSPFNGVPKDNFTVEVPESAVNAYRSAPYWNEFKRISAYRGFVCRPSSANVLNAGGSREIILNADADWTMTSCPDWCHISSRSGHKKTTLILTIDPLPHGQGNRLGMIEFKLDDSDEHYTRMTVEQYDYEYEEDEYVSLQKSSKGNGIDVFIVGDGYDAADISSGLYLEDMRQGMEYFFGVEPYRTYHEYFDVHTAIALSYESGIGTLNTLRNVKFETTYGDFVNARINGNSEAVVEYAVETVEEITSDNIHQLTAVVIPNSDLYDGVTSMWTNGTAVAFCPKSSADYPWDARGLIQHEVGGHAFGKLGDEYMYHNGFIQTCKCYCCNHVEGISDAQSRGWYRNLSLNGKYKEIEWAHLVFDPRYSDIVDVYEGGYFHRRGVYRSEYNSCMNDNVPYFSTISRQAIVERIMEYAGEEFSFEDFVAKDSREWGIDFTDSVPAKSMTEYNLPISVHRHHPIVIEGSPLD